MPWTKLNYPASMKNLTVAVRTKAIEIANAILKTNKKMKEGMIIATAMKRAEEMATKTKAKTKSVAGKKTKATPERKVKTQVTKKIKVAETSTVRTKAKDRPIAVEKKRPAKRKAATLAKKKIESPVKKKETRVAHKQVKKTATVIGKTVPKLSIKTHIKIKTRLAVERPAKKIGGRIESASLNNTPLPNLINPVIHEHLIPEKGNIHPITTFETHQMEKVLHHREEVAFHQENKKIKAAMSSRKNDKRTYRLKGRR